MPKVKCKQCQTYLERDEAYRTSVQSFCSMAHYIAYQNTTPKSRPKVNRELETSRVTVMALDGGRCRVCGTKYNLHAHHIVYRSEKKDDSVRNLIMLCQKHHDLVHSNKKFYQPECKRIVALREGGNIHARIKLENNGLARGTDLHRPDDRSEEGFQAGEIRPSSG